MKAQLSKEFEMKNLGRARKILGMEIMRDKNKGRLCFTQRQYLEKVVARFGMENLKPVSIPLTPHFKLLATMSPSSEAEVEYITQISYTSVVGSLMYAMECTWPDIA